MLDGEAYNFPGNNDPISSLYKATPKETGPIDGRVEIKQQTIKSLFLNGTLQTQDTTCEEKEEHLQSILASIPYEAGKSSTCFLVHILNGVQPLIHTAMCSQMKFVELPGSEPNAK